MKIVEDGPVESGQGGLRCNDIPGASPSKFGVRSRRVFVDRNEIKSVLGQDMGKYHGYVKDFKQGGTYNPESDSPSNMIVSDLNKVAKSKLKNKFTRSNSSIHEGGVSFNTNNIFCGEPSKPKSMSNFSKIETLLANT